MFILTFMISLPNFRPVACYSWRFGVGDFAQVRFNTGQDLLKYIQSISSFINFIEIYFIYIILYHFCFESLIAPRLIGLKEIHMKSTQRNLGKRRPSQWWGEVNCQKISWNVNLKNLPQPGQNKSWPKSSHTTWKNLDIPGQNVFISRIIITYNDGGYTDPAFFFREVNER